MFPRLYAFTSETVAPATSISDPPPSRLAVAITAPAVIIRWTGRDDDGVITQRPIKYRYKLVSQSLIQQALGLPDAAFSYLRSHGTLDQEHTRHLAELMEKMTPEDQADVVHAAKVFFRLYAEIFRALPV